MSLGTDRSLAKRADRKQTPPGHQADDIDSAALCTLLDTHYEIGPVTCMRSMYEGRTATLSIVESECGSFIFRQNRFSTSIDRYRFQCGIQRYLSKQDVCTPVPIHTIHGKQAVYIVSGGVQRLCHLSPFIDGDPTGVSETDLADIGRFLGRMHKELASLPDRSRTTQSFQAWLQTFLTKPAERLNPLLRTERHKRLLHQVSTQCIRKLSGHTEEVSRRISVSHGDAHNLNFLRRSDGSLCLLDWEHAHVGWPLYDLATLLWGALGYTCNVDQLNAAITGYERAWPLHTWEREALPSVMAIRHIWWLGFHISVDQQTTNLASVADTSLISDAMTMLEEIAA